MNKLRSNLRLAKRNLKAIRKNTKALAHAYEKAAEKLEDPFEASILRRLAKIEVLHVDIIDYILSIQEAKGR